MWTLYPKHNMANIGFLFHCTPFDREYPHPLNDFVWRVYFQQISKSFMLIYSTLFSVDHAALKQVVLGDRNFKANSCHP